MLLKEEEEQILSEPQFRLILPPTLRCNLMLASHYEQDRKRMAVCEGGIPLHDMMQRRNSLIFPHKKPHLHHCDWFISCTQMQRAVMPAVYTRIPYSLSYCRIFAVELNLKRLICL